MSPRWFPGPRRCMSRTAAPRRPRLAEAAPLRVSLTLPAGWQAAPGSVGSSRRGPRRRRRASGAVRRPAWSQIPAAGALGRAGAMWLLDRAAASEHAVRAGSVSLCRGRLLKAEAETSAGGLHSRTFSCQRIRGAVVAVVASSRRQGSSRLPQGGSHLQTTWNCSTATVPGLAADLRPPRRINSKKTKEIDLSLKEIYEKDSERYDHSRPRRVMRGPGGPLPVEQFRSV